MCDIDYGGNENKDQIVCGEDEIIQIKEAKYGRSDGASKCNMSNKKISCPSRNSWKKYLGSNNFSL